MHAHTLTHRSVPSKYNKVLSEYKLQFFFFLKQTIVTIYSQLSIYKNHKQQLRIKISLSYSFTDAKYLKKTGPAGYTHSLVLTTHLLLYIQPMAQAYLD